MQMPILVPLQIKMNDSRSRIFGQLKQIRKSHIQKIISVLFVRMTFTNNFKDVEENLVYLSFLFVITFELDNKVALQ